MMRRYERMYDLDLQDTVEQRHPEWAKPFAGGKMRAFIVPDMHNGRDYIELCQRFELEYDNVTIDRNWDTNRWGFGEFYNDNRTAVHDFSIVYQNLENALTSDEHYDLLVLPGLNGWGLWSEATRQAIVDRVANGAGLVLIKPFDGIGEDGVLNTTTQLAELSALVHDFNEGFRDNSGYPLVDKEALQREPSWTLLPHEITRGVPAELIDFSELSFYPYHAAEGAQVLVQSASGKPIMAVRPYKKGRVVTIGWTPRGLVPQHADHVGGGFADSVAGNGQQQSTTYNYLEYFYSLLYRAMAWAADRMPQASLQQVTASDQQVAFTTQQADGAQVTARVWDAWDQQVWQQTVDANAGVVQLPAWLAQLGGEYRCDLLLNTPQGVADWQTVKLPISLKSQVTNLQLDAEIYKAGDNVVLTANYTGADNAEIYLLLEDNNHRVLAQQGYAPGTQVQLTYPMADWPSLFMFAFAEVWVDGHRVQRVRGPKALVSPGNHRFLKDFEAFLAGQPRGHGDLVDLQREIFLDNGITGAYPGSNKTWVASGAGGMGVYWYHRHPYVARKEQYITTNDPKALVRVPCLNDPAFWQASIEKITQTVQENKKYMPVAYFANDEGSITCYVDEQDLCFCPHCMAAMHTWLQNRYGSLEALNQAWDTAFESWDAVQPDTFRQAKARRKYAAWGDHRLFMEHTFANAYKTIADTVKAQDPQGVIRMSGCQASSVYSGYDYYMLHRHIGYFEAYGGGNQYEMHRSFKDPNTVVGCWLGYGARGKSIQHNIWYALFHGITLVSIFWEASCLNPDFTTFQGFEDMGETFKQLRHTGVGKLLLYGTKRDNLGIAVHYSMPSIHASYIDNHHNFYNDNRQGWLDILEDMGYQYDLVSTQQIEADHLIQNGFRVLIMPYSRAVSEQEQAAIRRFVEQGGVLLADCQCGLYNASLKEYPVPCFDDIFGIVHHTRYQRGGAGADVNNPDFPYFSVQEVDGDTYPSGMPIVETEVRVTTGKPLLVQDFTRIMPSTIVNPYGQGYGIYLNSSLVHYPGERNGISRIREILRQTLSFAGVSRPLVVEDANGEEVQGGLERFYYQQGDAHYVGLLRGFEDGMRVAYDGRMTGDVDGAADKACFTLKMDQEYHLYDVLQGKYLGYGKVGSVYMAPGEAAVVALLPYGPDGLQMDLPQTVQAGQTVQLHAALAQAQAGSVPTWNLQVYDPDGRFDPFLSQNVAAAQLDLAVQFPYNAKPGAWRVVVREVASGQTQQRSLEVQA